MKEEQHYAACRLRQNLALLLLRNAPQSLFACETNISNPNRDIVISGLKSSIQQHIHNN